LSIRKPLGAITRGFSLETLSKAAVVTSGALGNAWLSGMIGGFMPGFLATGIGSYATGLASAGLLGAGVGMVAPRFAAPIFFGGVLEVMMRAFKQYVTPLIPGMSGLGDYLTREDAATARPLGDYLTRQDAATARPLGNYYGEEYIAEELAG
jgi:hypothetical protein